MPSLNNGLIRRFPSDRLEVFGKVKGTHKGQHMRLEAVQVRVVKSLDSGFFYRTVHPLGLPVRPRVIRFRQLVSNAVLIANAAKDVHSQKGMDGLVSILGQVGKSHAVVCQNSMDFVGEGLDDATQEVCAIHFSHIVPKFDITKLGNSVNGQEHIEFALGQAQLGNVDVHVADFGRRKLASATGFNFAGGQPRDAMPEQTTVQARAAELRDALA